MRISVLCLALLLPSRAPAQSLEHGECIQFLLDAYKARDELNVTANYVISSAETAEVAAARDAAIAANQAISLYLKSLRAFCESKNS